MKEAYYHIYEAAKHLALASAKTKYDPLEVVCRDTNSVLQDLLRLIEKKTREGLAEVNDS
jgi:hypothetical protein